MQTLAFETLCDITDAEFLTFQANKPIELPVKT